jgi:hypothetical protein
LLSPASAFRHRHSGIMVSPVPLVTDQSVSAQLCRPEIFRQESEGEEGSALANYIQYM